MRIPAVFLTLSLLATVAPAAEMKLPRPSPAATVMQTIGLTDVTVSYSRPGVKGRVIWGDLVPYDKTWRTGANEATKIVFSDDVMVEGKKLAAGSYSFFTIPAKGDWTAVFSNQKELWGSTDYDEKQDALRVTVHPQPAEMQEWMRFSFENLSVSSAQLVLQWEKLKVSLKIETDTIAKALASARAAIAEAKPDDWRVFQSAPPIPA